MEEEKQTRSSMLWQVGRLLKECYADNKLPDVLLMENVPMIHSIENVGQFNKWMLDLEKLGYQNYWKDMIATDFGVPQIRNRTFMVSVKNRFYEFPKPIPLQSRLVDLLEDNVDESFYINEEDMKKLIYDNSPNNLHIKCATKQGYLEATLGDGVDISKRMRTHRGTVQKGKSQTLSTMGGSTQGVVTKITPKVIAGFGKVGSTNQYHQQNRVYEGDTAISVTTAFNPYYKTDLCIRKITPRECFRLMGVKDEDINKLAELPNNVQYHLAGDSIVTTVLMAIFGELLNIDWQNKVKDIMERMCK